MPVIQKITLTGKTRGRIDVLALHAIFANIEGLAGIVFEDVVSRAGEGATAAFSFGHGCGCIETVARLTGAPVTMVPPRAWKGAFGLSAAKNESRHLATRLTGDVEPFRRAKDDGRAEAALLAIYGASNGIVADQSVALDAFRKQERARPIKPRRSYAPARTGEEVLNDLRARCSPTA